MKLTDFLSDVGRPIAYYPALRKITGSTTATILLCQFIYWRGKESDPNGWLYKTSDEIEEETGLSYNEQKTARANLVSAELIEEHYARLDHQMKFRVNLDMINLLWGTEQPIIPESDNPSFGKAISQCSLNDTEITAENTQPATIEKQKPIIPGIEASIYSNRHTTTDDLPLMELALTEFHAALSLPHNWNWYPAKTSDESVWRELREFIFKEWQKDDQTFRKYAKWRATPYMKGALSNVAIQRRPTEFITSWSDYLASSSMYGSGNRDKGFAL